MNLRRKLCALEKGGYHQRSLACETGCCGSCFEDLEVGQLAAGQIAPDKTRLSSLGIQ